MIKNEDDKINDKKNDECNDNQNDKQNEKINILTWPSLWLQVFHKSTATFWVKTITTTVETNKETDAKVTGGEPARSAGSCELGERADSKPQKR